MIGQSGEIEGSLALILRRRRYARSSGRRRPRRVVVQSLTMASCAGSEEEKEDGFILGARWLEEDDAVSALVDASKRSAEELDVDRDSSNLKNPGEEMVQRPVL